jgi:hypothetical protein
MFRPIRLLVILPLAAAFAAVVVAAASPRSV